MIQSITILHRKNKSNQQLSALKNKNARCDGNLSRRQISAFECINSRNQFWMTTGLYPHEIVVHLQNPQPVRTVRFESTNVRKIQVEVCEAPHIGNFTKVNETEIGSLSGGLQLEFIEANSGGPVSYVKMVIVSGWDIL